MAVQQAGGNADPRIQALSVAINLEELDPTPFLQYLKTQVEYYALDKGPVHPDFGDDEVWVESDEEFTGPIRTESSASSRVSRLRRGLLSSLRSGCGLKARRHPASIWRSRRPRAMSTVHLGSDATVHGFMSPQTKSEQRSATCSGT